MTLPAVPPLQVMAILALLVEVYNLDNIKTGLKFEASARTDCAGDGCTTNVPPALWRQWRRQAVPVPCRRSHDHAAPHPPSDPPPPLPPPRQVELLFKSMNMQLQDVQPSGLLAGRRRESLDNIDFQVPGGCLTGVGWLICLVV